MDSGEGNRWRKAWVGHERQVGLNKKRKKSSWWHKNAWHPWEIPRTLSGCSVQRGKSLLENEAGKTGWNQAGFNPLRQSSRAWGHSGRNASWSEFGAQHIRETKCGRDKGRQRREVVRMLGGWRGKKPKPSRTLKKIIWIRNHEWLTWISKVREKLEIFRRQSCPQWTIIPHGVAGTGKSSAWFQFEIKGSTGMWNLGEKEQIYEGRINVLDMDPVEFEVTQGPQNRSINA